MELNTQLNIPASVQTMLDAIENQPLYLAEVAIAEHPKLPNFNRFVRVYGIDAKSKLEFVHFDYKQVLRDKETGEEIGIELPVPDWTVYKDTWSYMRDSQNKPIALPLKEGSEETETKVRVPSYKYMIWLMANNKAGLLQLIQGYLADFVRAKQEELDKL